MFLNTNPSNWRDDETARKIIQRRQLLQSVNDIDSLKKEIQELIFCVSSLVNQIHTLKLPVPSWGQSLEPLLIKFAHHASSILQISIKVPIAKLEDRVVESWDIGSVFTLFRAAIECYLMNYHLFYGVEDPEEGVFKFKLYQLSGIANRQKYPVTQEETKKKLESERLQMEQLQKELQAHPFFLNLTKAQQQSIKGSNPPAKLSSWVDLIKNSPLKNEYFLGTWKLKSNYAHSEFISSIQLRDYYQDSTTASKEMFSSLELLEILVSIQITSLLNVFPQLLDYYISTFPSRLKGNVCLLSGLGTTPN